MHGTRRHGHHRSGYQREAPSAPAFWGWSPATGQMEMMDLRAYADAIRAAYDRALDDLYGRMSALSGLYGSGGAMGMPGTAPAPGRRGNHRGDGEGGCCGDHEGGGHGHGEGHGHGHAEGGHGHHEGGCGHGHGHGHGKGHGRHEEGCGGGHGGHHGHGRHERGCGDDADCRCECCIVDADIVVYARCGEIRVIPIEIENDTRRDRDDVGLEVSEFRSGGGRALPWKAKLSPAGPLTIKGCSTARLELLVSVACAKADAVDPRKDKDVKPGKETVKRAAGDVEAEGAADDRLLVLVRDQRDRTGGVDSCEVGYVTVRVDGCLVRPIVVAVAVLPDDCGAYAAGCSCGDCC